MRRKGSSRTGEHRGQPRQSTPARSPAQAGAPGVAPVGDRVVRMRVLIACARLHNSQLILTFETGKGKKKKEKREKKKGKGEKVTCAPFHRIPKCSMHL